ncbi:MAG: glycosyltransferase family 39 protein, partial [Terriglobales bacterium]
MRRRAISRLQAEDLVVLLLATVVSVTAFVYFFRTGQLLLYGDAVAHLNIARRVVDSLTPGPLQLGTVWLPFPHLLTLPLVWIDSLWQSGIAGSIPSMLAYVVGTMGMLRLGKSVTSPAGARIATIIYATNPNLIYMQSTAMTESIFLATVIWAVYFVVQYVQAVRENDEVTAARSLYKAAAAFLCAIFTRYDGWFLGAVAVVLVLVVGMTARSQPRKLLLPAVRNFLLLMALGPAIWLTYNYAIFSDPMEFATGPYSARGIAERTTKKGDPPHPGFHSVQTAGIYFAKTARLNVAEGKREWWLPAI